MSVSPIPQGYHSVTPYLVVNGAEAAIRFYEQAFGAKEKLRLPMGDKLGHAEIQIGDSIVMLADEFPEMDQKGPNSRGGPSSSILLYVEDVDSAFRQALDAGATEESAVADQFWGDRMGTLRDPFGHRWSMATAMEEVAPDELQRRMEAMTAEGQPG